MNDLNDIYYFAKIIEHGGLSPASEALGVAKSMLSKHLAKLESELGVRLVHRTTRRVQITETGARYYERCRAVLAAVDQAGHVIDDARESPRGRIRIASPANFTQSILVPLLTTFMGRYPEVDVLVDSTNREVDLIADGYDLVLHIGSTVSPTQLVRRSFNMNRNILVASPELLARFGEPRTPQALAALPSLVCGVPTKRVTRHTWELTSPSGKRLAIAHKPRLVAEDLFLLKQSAVAGCGVVDLPSHICRDELQSGRLLRVLHNWSLPVVKLHLMHQSRRELTLALTTLIDYLSTHVRPWIDSAAKGTLRWRMAAEIGSESADDA